MIIGLTNMDRWGLAIAAEAGAELKTTTETRETDYFNLLAHSSSIAEQSNQIAIYEKHTANSAQFFKAKKLVLQDHKKEQLLSQLLNRKEQMNPQILSSSLDSELLNLVKTNELNLATCLELFTWVDISLDDVEKLC